MACETCNLRERGMTYMASTLPWTICVGKLASVPVRLRGVPRPQTVWAVGRTQTSVPRLYHWLSALGVSVAAVACGSWCTLLALWSANSHLIVIVHCVQSLC